VKSISLAQKCIFTTFIVMSNIYEKLGIPTIINASGSMTELGGSIMTPRVAQALAAASQHYVHLPSLKKNLENRIADMLQVPGACISSCATAGIILSAAACMTRGKPGRIKSLPRTDEFPHVFLTPEVHRNRFDHAIQIAGGQVQPFDTDRTRFEDLLQREAVAGVYFTMSWFCQGDYIPIPEAAQIAQKYDKPIVVDAAAQLPPLDNFSRFLDQGADLVVFSGGKTIRGPQVSGLILGREDLIEACRLNNSPHIETIGRGMKISKEEIIALFIALEEYLQHDHQKDQEIWKNQLHFIKKALSHLDNLQIKFKFPYGPGYQLPYLELVWDHRVLSPPAGQLIQELIGYHKPIYARFNQESQTSSSILIYAHTLKEEEEKEIASALNTFFKKT
jgi:uncharacterized pyridoxal phosphate-dependent enzyme